jgi:hypothetical protein
VLVRLLRFYAHPPKIFGGEGLRKSHEGASSPLQERRRFQTKGFAKATKIPSKNALHSLLHHRVIVAAFNISRMRLAARFTTNGGVCLLIVYFFVYLYDAFALFVAQHALFYSPISHGRERLSIR